ncbi:MAG: YhcH/YjgK/YiaL family protein [Rikenellaceae bacterium]
MVLDSLKKSELYNSINPLFEKAFQYVIENSNNAPLGRYEIDGDNLFVMFVEPDLKKANDALLEAHNKYIDIQVVLSGKESFGWSQRQNCNSPIDKFNEEKDIIFFKDAPQTIITVNRGEFVILMPDDAHAPLIGEGKSRKAIIKVRV